MESPAGSAGIGTAAQAVIDFAPNPAPNAAWAPIAGRRGLTGGWRLGLHPAATHAAGVTRGTSVNVTKPLSLHDDILALTQSGNCLLLPKVRHRDLVQRGDIG